jgi:hypothetical protein
MPSARFFFSCVSRRMRPLASIGDGATNPIEYRSIHSRAYMPPADHSRAIARRPHRLLASASWWSCPASKNAHEYGAWAWMEHRLSRRNLHAPSAPLCGTKVGIRIRLLPSLTIAPGLAKRFSVDSRSECDYTKVAATTQKRMRLKQGCSRAEKELLSIVSFRWAGIHCRPDPPKAHYQAGAPKGYGYPALDTNSLY